MRDLFNNYPMVQLLPNQAINDTDTKSKLLDWKEFNKALIAVSIGDCTGLDADSTLELFLEESDLTTDVSFTAVPVLLMNRSTTGLSSESTAGLFGTLNLASEDQTIVRVEYKGIKRYIRARLDFTTGTGGISAAPVCVIGMLGDARHAPAAAPAPVTAT